MANAKFFRVIGRHRGFTKDEKSDPDEYPQFKGISGGVTITARTSKNRMVIKAAALSPNPSLVSLWPFDVKLDDGRLKTFADSEDPAHDQPDVLLVANCSALGLDPDEKLIYEFAFRDVTANGQRQSLPTFSFVAPFIPDIHDDGTDGIVAVDWTTVPWLESAGSIPGGQIIEMVPDDVTLVGPNAIQFWANGSALGDPIVIDVEVSQTVAWSAIDGRPVIYDEDDLASDSATGVPTQQSVKAFVVARTTGLGTGDMRATVYDPNGVAGSAFSQDNMVDGLTNKNFTAALLAKLLGIAAGATVNDTDANLRNRTNHTGTQLASSISNFAAAADARISSAAGNTVAPLVGGLVPTSYIPAVALTTVQTAASQAVMLSLATQEGDIVVRTDQRKTYMRNANATGTVADFTLLDTPVDVVTSVNGQLGIVVLGKADVGLGNADNTADVDKPISTAQQTALNTKQRNVITGTTGNGASATTKAVNSAVTPTAGDIVSVTFTNGNTASGVALNFNTSTAYPVALVGNTAVNAASLQVAAGGTVAFLFTGSQFQMLGVNAHLAVPSQAEIDAGTQTAGRLISAQLLKANLDTKQPKATGTPDGTKFYRDDNTWAVPPGGGGGGSGFDTYANMPAANTVPAGYLYVCSDIDSVYRSTGSAWVLARIGGGVGGSEPPTAGWSTTTLAAATVAASLGGRLFTIPTSTSAAWRLETRELSPATNYVATAHLDATIGEGTDSAGVIAVTNGTAFIAFGPAMLSGGVVLRVQPWDSTAASSSVYKEAVIGQLTRGMPRWLRIRDDSTNRHYEYSYNGLDWRTFYSHGRTVFITPNTLAWGGRCGSASAGPQFVRLRSLVVT